MAGPRSEQEAIAAKLAAERAAREAEEARKREIMRQIKILEDEKAECEELIDSFSSLRSQVSMIQVASLKMLITHPETELFMGVTAAATEEGISGMEESLVKKESAITEVDAAIGSQIGQLNSYIMELNSRIRGLEAGL